MRKILTVAALTAGLLMATATAAVAVSPATAPTTPAVVATPAALPSCAGTGWGNWYAMTGPSWGVGAYCGEPSAGYWRTASQDGSADGRCTSIWSNGSLTNNTTFRYVPGTLACGYGYISRSSVQTAISHRLRVVSTNNTATVWYAAYEIYNSSDGRGYRPPGWAAPARAGVYDCSTNPDGTSWSAWNYLTDAAAGKWCPSPTVGDYSVHAWDRKADGRCASIGYQLTPGATVYPMGTVCGSGYISTVHVNNGWHVNALYTVSHVAGGWMNTVGTTYEQLW